MAVTCTCCSRSVDWWVRLRSHPDQPICHDCLGGLEAQRDGQLQLLSGSSLITGSEAVFAVSDVRRSMDWYRRAGFEVSRHDETYAFARRERALTIHLRRGEESEPVGRGELYLHCQEADRIADEWRSAGIDVVGPRNEEYGRREGSVRDPDGNVLRFGSPVH